MLSPFSARPLSTPLGTDTGSMATGKLVPLLRGSTTPGWPAPLIRGFSFAVLPRPTVPVNVVRGSKLIRNG